MVDVLLITYSIALKNKQNQHQSHEVNEERCESKPCVPITPNPNTVLHGTDHDAREEQRITEYDKIRIDDRD